MDEQAGLSDQYRKASPWPVFVALGLAVSEVGVLFGVLPLAVGGLLLFGASVAGVLREADYVERPWGTLAAFGVVLVAAGALAIWARLPSGGPSVAALLDPANGVAYRGLAIALAGAIMLSTGTAARYLERDAA